MGQPRPELGCCCTEKERSNSVSVSLPVVLESIGSDYHSVSYIYSPVVTVRTARFNIQQFYVLPTQCVYVFCVDLRTNSDYFPLQH
jgi:hypothetical protein